MSPSHSRATGLLAALVVAFSSLAVAGPVAAADSPEAAVNELIDMVVSGDFSAIDRVVCEEQHGAALRQFELRASLGVPSETGPTLAAITSQIESRNVELISQDGEVAIVRMSVTRTMALDEDEARELVRAMLEAEGEQVEDDDLDFMVPLMTAAFSEGQVIDEELTLLREGGQWLVCGGLGPDVPEPVGSEPSISFDGMCGLVTMAEINVSSPPELQYDSSFGAESYCSYSSSSYDDYYSVTVSLGQGDRLEDWQSFYPGGVELTAADLPAYAQAEQLFIGLPEGVLEVALFPGDNPPQDLDSTAYLTQLAELFVPLVGELELDTGFESVDPVLPDPNAPSLCEA